MSNSKFNVNFKFNNFPFEVINLDEKKKNKIKKYFTGEKCNYVLVGPKKYCLSEGYELVGSVVYNFPIRSNDVWLLGYPRSGTTLMQEMLWLIGNDLDYEKASQTIADIRFTLLESLLHKLKSVMLHNDNTKHTLNATNNNKKDEESMLMMEKHKILSIQDLIEMKEQRFIKTHLPISLINPAILKAGCKVIYIMRNPKDVLVSLYHLSITVQLIKFNGNLEEFWEYFRQNQCLLNPYFEHIKEGWENRHNPNFLFLYYEEIVTDMRKAIKKIANFMQKLLNDEQLDKLENHLKIENFRKNNSVNNDHLRKIGVMKDEDNQFIRKGKINGWKDYFTKEMNFEFDIWIKENLKDCDLKFFE